MNKCLECGKSIKETQIYCGEKCYGRYKYKTDEMFRYRAKIRLRKYISLDRADWNSYYRKYRRGNERWREWKRNHNKLPYVRYQENEGAKVRYWRKRIEVLT